MQMKLKKWTMPKALVVAMGLGLGTMTMVSLSNPTRVHARTIDDPNSIRIASNGGSGSAFSYATGKRGTGAHAVTEIKTESGQYVFCIQWAKEAPSGKDINKLSDKEIISRGLQNQYDNQAATQWLVNNFYSGHRYQSLGKGDEGDYWLYQAVIHWVADGNDTYDWNGGKNPYDYGGKNTREALNGMTGWVRDKVQALHDEAMKHVHDSTEEIVQENHSMSYDPSSLTINGKDDLKGNEYQKDFTFHKTQNMSKIHVWLDGAPEGVKLEGANGGYDPYDVWDNTAFRIKAPYRVNADKDQYSFKVKAQGTWNTSAKIAAIYQDSKGSGQAIERQNIVVKDIKMDSTIDMPVTVKPAKGSVSILKGGTGNNNQDILPNTEFEISGDGYSQKQTSDRNGFLKFENLPLGRDYHIKETKQPNKRYTTDFETTIYDLNGDRPALSKDLGRVLDHAQYTNIQGTKKNQNGQPLSGSKFVVVRSDQGNPKMSIDDAKKNALRLVNGELVEGHGDQQPYTATSDNNGNFNFNNILLPKDGQQHHYYAVEVEAPKGYTLSQDSLAFNVSEKSPDTVTGELKDSTMPLPATGSEKLLVVTVAGVVLAVIAGGVVYFNRKKTN